MARTYELTSELVSLRSDWHDLERACAELPVGLHVHGLMCVAMTQLVDRIEVLERNVTLPQTGQSPHLGAAA
jgi:hypothetical protein